MSRSSHWRCSIKNGSSRPEVFWERGVLRNFAKFNRKHLCQSFFFNRPATLLKKKLWHRCFHVNFAKFLRTTFLKEHLWWLLLKKAVLKNFAIFMGKNLSWSLFLIKLFQRSCFLVKFFCEHLFWRTFANGCFWKSSSTAMKNSICLLPDKMG